MIIMKVKLNNGEVIELADMVTNNTINLTEGQSIANIVFNNGKMLTSYRKGSSIGLSDMPTALNNTYLFITKISSTLAFAFSLIGTTYRIFVIIYINNQIVFREINVSNVT